jgi:predicted ester cyclase
VTVTGTNLMRFAHGQIVELWGYLDGIGMMVQLGAIPAPPGPEPALKPLEADASTAPAAAKAAVRRFVAGFNRKDPEALAREYGDGYVLDFPGGPKAEGIAGIKQAAGEFIAAFPDLQFTVDDLVAQGGYVVWRWQMTATHKGNLGPFLASNKPVHLSGISLLRVHDGKIVEDRVRADMIGLLQQIGAIPAPPPHG